MRVRLGQSLRRKAEPSKIHRSGTVLDLPEDEAAELVTTRRAEHALPEDPPATDNAPSAVEGIPAADGPGASPRPGAEPNAPGQDRSPEAPPPPSPESPPVPPRGRAKRRDIRAED